jgi:lipopolysaccharide transport system ATP-binding protein
MRLAFAVAAHLDPEILIVDEVLAVGDAEFQKKCLGKMGDVARGGRTVLFVSHNMAAVRNLCSKALLLVNGMVDFDGETDSGIGRYLKPVRAGHAAVEPNVLYQAPRLPHAEYRPEIAVERIELYGADGTARAETRTWGHATFRVYYSVRSPVRNAHLCVEITDTLGRRLLSLETRTHTRRDDLGLADGVAECSVPQLPLAPGTFAVGAAVFVPDQRLIWAGEQLGHLTVHTHDVFGCGHLPPASHSAVITPHDWIFPTRQ